MPTLEALSCQRCKAPLSGGRDTCGVYPENYCLLCWLDGPDSPPAGLLAPDVEQLDSLKKQERGAASCVAQGEWAVIAALRAGRDTAQLMRDLLADRKVLAELRGQIAEIEAEYIETD